VVREGERECVCVCVCGREERERERERNMKNLAVDARASSVGISRFFFLPLPSLSQVMAAGVSLKVCVREREVVCMRERARQCV